MNLNETKKEFFFNSLLPKVVSASSPRAINLYDDFRVYIRSIGYGDIRSAEIANRQFAALTDYLERQLSDWDAQGVPRPLTRTDQENVFLAWPHEQFLRYSGLEKSIDRNFCDFFQYVQTLNGKQFLIVCALWLKVLGFRKIFICDSRGDEGVDLLGLLQDGGLRSLIAVVQAKTSSEPIGRGLVLSEYGKYMMLPHTEKYIQYRRVLEIDSSIEGASWNYMLISNQTFNWSARQVASKLGILLRSVHQISYTLTRHYSRADIQTEIERLETSLKSDLTTNFFSHLKI